MCVCACVNLKHAIALTLLFIPWKDKGALKDQQYYQIVHPDDDCEFASINNFLDPNNWYYNI
jgi:hypothetical protein